MRRLKDIYASIDRPVGRTTLGRLCIALAIFLFVVVLFAYIADEVVEGETLHRDEKLLLLINHFATPVLNQCMLFITTLGDVTSILLATIVIGAYLLRRKKWQALTQLGFGIAGAAILNILLKLLFERQRPQLWDLLIHESTYSFPSGHAMLTSTLGLTIILLAWHTKWRWWVVGVVVLYVILVGFSRLYLGVHYPTDILAGWCIGSAWVIAVATILGAVRWRVPLQNRQ